MDTVGGRQDRIAGALRSFLAQDYPFAKLLIVNRHPTPLQVFGVPDEHKLRVEVINEEDTFVRPVYQHVWNLKAIRTDCWTILDDDDEMDLGHLSQLVKKWNECSDRTDAPLQVCSLNYKVHYADKVTDLKFRGWAVSLFERLTAKEVDWCFKLFPGDVVVGSDTWIAWNSYFDKREFEGQPTYHWDRTGLNHISQHEVNCGVTEKEKFDMTANYWRIKLNARNQELKPVIL